MHPSSYSSSCPLRIGGERRMVGRESVFSVPFIDMKEFSTRHRCGNISRTRALDSGGILWPCQVSRVTLRSGHWAEAHGHLQPVPRAKGEAVWQLRGKSSRPELAPFDWLRMPPHPLATVRLAANCEIFRACSTQFFSLLHRQSYATPQPPISQTHPWAPNCSPPVLLSPVASESLIPAPHPPRYTPPR